MYRKEIQCENVFIRLHIYIIVAVKNNELNQQIQYYSTKKRKTVMN